MSVAAWLAGIVITRGSYPSVDDTPEQSRARSSEPASIAALLLYIASVVALVVFATALRSLVAAAGAGWEALATAGALMTAVAVALSSSGMALALMAGWRAQERAPELTRDDSDRFIFLNNVSALPAATGALLLAAGTLAVEEPAGWTARGRHPDGHAPHRDLLVGRAPGDLVAHRVLCDERPALLPTCGCWQSRSCCSE